MESAYGQRNEAAFASRDEAGHLYRYHGKADAIKRAKRLRDNALSMITVAHYERVITILEAR